ncbi:MAG TPA: ATP-binding protein [Geminicoccaceae bacterium]|nr:ATP-binding protein [Geminicoccaceae bacterium]
MASPAALSRPLSRRRGHWRLLPRTLFGRSLLIVVLPLLILQAGLAYVFYERHWDAVTRWLSLGFAGEVALLVEQLDRAETAAARSELLDLARQHLGIAVSLEPGARLGPGATAGGLLPPAHADRALRESFAEVLNRPFRIDTRELIYPRRIAVYVQLDAGLLRVLAPRKRIDSTTTTLFMIWMVGLSMLLVAVAIYFLRRQVRPIRRLAQAADSFGKGRDVGDFKLEGAIEIRQAGAAFNLMRERILRHLAQRTEMLAAVSHDLRTPLTRMKLELEMLRGGGGGTEPRAEIEDLRADLGEMERLVESYLAFARGEGREAVVPTDLGGLLAEIAERAGRDGTRIELSVPEPIELPLRPLAFRRCITNLVDNARRYGRRVAIEARDRAGAVEVIVDDDGPGIPPEHREEAFKPFYRVEGSRNPDTGGVGLGLAIARDIVLAHGGDIALDAAPLGGLRAVVRVPH